MWTIHHPGDHPPFQDDPAYFGTLEYYSQEFGLPQVQFWPDPDVASVRTSSILIWSIGIAALVLSLVFSSMLFALFGLAMMAATLFLKWKFSSLPLRASGRKGAT